MEWKWSGTKKNSIVLGEEVVGVIRRVLLVLLFLLLLLLRLLHPAHRLQPLLPLDGLGLEPADGDHLVVHGGPPGTVLERRRSCNT